MAPVQTRSQEQRNIDEQFGNISLQDEAELPTKRNDIEPVAKGKARSALQGGSQVLPLHFASSPSSTAAHSSDLEIAAAPEGDICVEPGVTPEASAGQGFVHHDSNEQSGESDKEIQLPNEPRGQEQANTETEPAAPLVPPILAMSGPTAMQGQGQRKGPKLPGKQRPKAPKHHGGANRDMLGRLMDQAYEDRAVGERTKHGASAHANAQHMHAQGGNAAGGQGGRAANGNAKAKSAQSDGTLLLHSTYADMSLQQHQITQASLIADNYRGTLQKLNEVATQAKCMRLYGNDDKSSFGYADHKLALRQVEKQRDLLYSEVLALQFQIMEQSQAWNPHNMLQQPAPVTGKPASVMGTNPILTPPHPRSVEYQQEAVHNMGPINNIYPQALYPKGPPHRSIKPISVHSQNHFVSRLSKAPSVVVEMPAEKGASAAQQTLPLTMAALTAPVSAVVQDGWQRKAPLEQVQRFKGTMRGGDYSTVLAFLEKFDSRASLQGLSDEQKVNSISQCLDDNALTWYCNNQDSFESYDHLRMELVKRFLTEGQSPDKWLDNLKLNRGDDIMAHNDLFTSMIRNTKLYMGRSLDEGAIVSKYLDSLPLPLSTRLLTALGDQAPFSQYRDRARVAWAGMRNALIPTALASAPMQATAMAAAVAAPTAQELAIEYPVNDTQPGPSLDSNPAALQTLQQVATQLCAVMKDNFRHTTEKRGRRRSLSSSSADSNRRPRKQGRGPNNSQHRGQQWNPRPYGPPQHGNRGGNRRPNRAQNHFPNRGRPANHQGNQGSQGNQGNFNRSELQDMDVDHPSVQTLGNSLPSSNLTHNVIADPLSLTASQQHCTETPAAIVNSATLTAIGTPDYEVQLQCCAVQTEKCKPGKQKCNLHTQVIPEHIAIDLSGAVPTVQLDIKGIKITALLDTGAAVTLIDSRLHSRHSGLKQLRLVPTPYKLKSAAQKPMSTKGQITVPITLGTIKRNWPAIVTDNLAFPVILGFDFIKQVLYPPVHTTQHTIAQDTQPSVLIQAVLETDSDQNVDHCGDYLEGLTFPVLLQTECTLEANTHSDFVLPCRLTKAAPRTSSTKEKQAEELECTPAEKPAASNVICMFAPHPTLTIGQSVVAASLFPFQWLSKQEGTLKVPLQTVCMAADNILWPRGKCLGTITLLYPIHLSTTNLIHSVHIAHDNDIDVDADGKKMTNSVNITHETQHDDHGSPTLASAVSHTRHTANSTQVDLIDLNTNTVFTEVEKSQTQESTQQI